jgi:hypothetical protein
VVSFFLLGIAAGGSAQRVSARTLVAGILLEAVAVAAFVPLAYSGGDLGTLPVMAVDSFGLSFAGSRSSPMSSRPVSATATQYAVVLRLRLSRGIPQGFSGQVVDTLSQGAA